jgi:prepilin-type N-terminal cleavage/methylation domain-containing protein
VFLVSFCKSHPHFTLDEVAAVTLSRFTISRRRCTLKFVFPARTSSRHAAVPPPRDEGGFTSPTSDPPKDGFAACSRMLFGVANRRPEFIRPGRRGDRGGTSEKRSRFSGFAVKQRERTRAFTVEQRERACAFTVKQRERARAFTLLELLIVIFIIAIMMVLVAPAFTNLKSAGDVTSAAYTIKGVLDQACTYAKTNNTYTWVGFYEEDVSQPSTNPATAGTGRLVMSIVASEDGTIIYDPTNLAPRDLTTSLIQVGKLTKIDNVHLWTHTDTPSGTGSTFDSRPNVTSTLCIGDTSPPNSTTPFQYPVGSPAPTAQYTFVKAVQFSPRGDARIDNSTVNANGTAIYPLQTAAEVGLEPTHGNVAPTSIPANVVAIQFTGVGADVIIYRR